MLSSRRSSPDRAGTSRRSCRSRAPSSPTPTAKAISECAARRSAPDTRRRSACAGPATTTGSDYRVSTSIGETGRSGSGSRRLRFVGRRCVWRLVPDSRRSGASVSRGRALLSALAFVLALMVFHVASASANPGVFSLDRLRLGGAAGAESYVYTAGDLIYPDGGVDAGTYYRAVVTDASGATRNSPVCRLYNNFPTVDTYTIGSTDPASTGTPWKYTLNQYANPSCTGTPAKMAAKNFYVAKPTTYGDSALTTIRNAFSAGTTAYVVIPGVKPGINDWSSTWLLPSGQVACANTAGNDRADSQSNGNLPKNAGTFLQYRPNTTSNGSNWNRESNYETRPCPTFSAANEGSWKLRVQVDATNFVTVPAFDVDVTAPATPTIDSHPPDPSASTSASFTFSGESGASFLCQLDGGGFSACTIPKGYSGLAEGAHSFQVKGVDAVGNESSPSSFNWTIDTTAPAAPTIGSHPPDPSTSTSASFTFSGESGATFFCELDGGGFSACTSPKAYSGLGEGAHSFSVKATDAAGNESAVTTYAWTIDTTPPATPSIDSHPADPTNSTNADFTFSGESGLSFLCQLGGGGFSACTSPKSYSGLGEGPHTFQVKARDDAGNESAVSSFNWTIDTAPPSAPTIDTHPFDPSNSTSPSFGFSGESGASFSCRLDGGGFSACTSPKGYSGLGEGAHSFSVKATDAAGNESSVTTYAWSIDTTPPAAPSIDSHPTDPSFSSDADFTFSGESGATLFCRLDGSGFSACTSPKGYSGLGDGTHSFEVKAVDTAGNESGVASFGWTIDTTPPSAPTIDTHPADPSNSTSPSFGFSGESGASFSCRLDGGGFSACTSPKGYSGLGEGAHSFSVKATDAAGNESSVTTYAWSIDTTPPAAPSIDSHPTDPSFSSD